MNKFIGMVVMVAGLVLMLYVGAWWAFVGGAVQVIDAAKSTPTDTLWLALGFGRLMLAGAFFQVGAIFCFYGYNLTHIRD